MEDLRKCWKVPYIVYYCSLLEETLDLIDLRVDEFEEAIIDDSGSERNIIIVHLLQKLLKPFVNRTIDLNNFESLLLNVLKKYNEENLFLNNKEDNHWNDLTILNKIDIIHLLCELRLQLSDIEAKFNNIDPNCLRIEPIGSDSFDNKLWYFGDLRLYEEKSQPKVEKKVVQATPSKRSSKAKNRKKRSSEEEKQQQEDNDMPILKEEKVDWHCVCITLEDWNDYTSKYKKSRKKQDQELYRILEENYLNEMPALFHKAEKERQQRLLALAPKRTSQRLVVKRQTTTAPVNYSETAYTEEQEIENDPSIVEKLKKEELSKQREERLKMREVRKDVNNNSDDNSQSSSMNESHHHHHSNTNSSDFNARNHLLMKKVLNKILSCKYSWPFKTAVTEDDAPDYKTIVEHPIDLSIIQVKVNNKLYKSRYSFCEDLQLIVSNCCLYNGVDSFYGKIALKFEAYFKRTLQIAYPREISNSFEEKNRLLLKLSSATSTSAGVAAATNEEENDSFLDDENKNGNTTLSNENAVNKENENESDEHKDNNESEYVTKRTSSGRLVKMKVSRDYDYESEEDEKNKKRKNKYYADDEFVANGNRNNRKRNDNSDLSETSFDGDVSQFSKRKISQGRKRKSNLKNSDDEDIDVNGDSSFSDKEESDSDYSEYEDNEYKKAQKRRGRKSKPTIDELLNSDENTSSTNDGSSRASKKLTFDQYVKILTGTSSTSNNNTNGSTNGLKSILTTSSTTSSSSTNVLSSSAAANASKLIKNINIDKLKVPIINPVVTAVLEANKLKQLQQHQQPQPSTPTRNSAIDDLNNDTSPPNILNVDSLTKSIKIIAMPQHLQQSQSPTQNNSLSILSPNNNNTNIITNGVSSKKVIFVNGTTVSQSSPASTPPHNNSNSSNLIKIVNLTQPPTVNNSPTSIKILSQSTTTTTPLITPISKTVPANRQIIVINNQQNVNKSPQQQSVQILTKINGNSQLSPSTQVIKITTNQNSQPNIQTITKLTPTTVITTTPLNNSNILP